MLLLALGGTGVVIVFLCIVVLLVRHRIAQRHRVDPSVRTEAPLVWLVDPRAPARLHRRLVRIGHTASAISEDHRPPTRRLRRSEPPRPIAVVADDLRRHAVVVDSQVARLAVLAPRARYAPMADLTESVDELERAAVRLMALSAEVRAPRMLEADDPALLAVAGRIDRLADAHRDLIEIERSLGLVPEPRIALAAPPVDPPPPTYRPSARPSSGS